MADVLRALIHHKLNDEIGEKSEISFVGSPRYDGMAYFRLKEQFLLACRACRSYDVFFGMHKRKEELKPPLTRRERLDEFSVVTLKIHQDDKISVEDAIKNTFLKREEPDVPGDRKMKISRKIPEALVFFVDASNCKLTLQERIQMENYVHDSLNARRKDIYKLEIVGERHQTKEDPNHYHVYWQDGKGQWYQLLDQCTMIDQFILDGRENIEILIYSKQ